MIQAKEIRLGNTIAGALNKHYEVTGKVMQMALLNPEYFDPIPLTPDVLEKCGALHYNNKAVDYVLCPLHGQDIGMKQYAYKSTFYLVGDRWQPEIKYLHQLQNLYFALTGNELEVNL